jgi:hypothetical protein
MKSEALAQRYLESRSFLLLWKPFWSLSITEDWGTLSKEIPPDFLDATRDLAPQDLYELARNTQAFPIPKSLETFIGSVGIFSQLGRRAGMFTLPSNLARNLTPKKRHEIESIVWLLKTANPAQVLDIGGGCGHLARTLAKIYHWQLGTFDQSPVLQETGIEYAKVAGCEELIQFHLGNFPKDFSRELLAQFAKPTALSIGLHTCGPLAWSHLESAGSSGKLLNFGCCYELLNPATETNRSRLAQEHPLPFNRESLFLITRGGLHSNQKGFLHQQDVLEKRYTFDLLLRETGHTEKARAVGTAPNAVYRLSFSDYVQNRLTALGIKPSGLLDSPEGLENYRKSKKETLRAMLLATLLRNLLARPLELSLLIDRALYLAQNTAPGVPEVELLEVFSSEISPRNMAIARLDP